MKKYKNYIITGIIAFLILAVVCAIKNFYPFGNDYIIWGDLHSQITAMYYYFYDAIYDNKSLFVNFFNGGGVNFWGILAYYICSPLTLITLLFPRDMLMHSVTIIIGLKIILSSITCLYLIKNWFKKIDTKYAILLSIIYAFSSYSLIMNIIPAYLDAVYLLPLLFVGLKKMLDGEGIKGYIVLLTLLIITNFYLSVMLLIIIALLSIIYIKIFNKQKEKEVVIRLGISTLIAIMISAVILLPTVNQILQSSRISLDFKTIFNSGLGPISDKVLFFVTLGLPIASVLLLITQKKSKRFMKVLLPMLVVLCIPILIEPVNKMLHLGSYVCYPYRYGFINVLLFIIGGAYFLNNKGKSEKKSIFPLIITVVASGIIIFLSFKYYTGIQSSVDHLSFSYDKKYLFIMVIIFLISFLSYYIILRKNDKYNVLYVSAIALTVVLTNCLFYFGIDFDQNNLQKSYDDMLLLYENKNEDGYRLKVPDNEFIENISMVSGFNSLGHFTSLINKNAFVTYQKLGYDTFWLNTLSSGSNAFIDALLGHKYLFSESGSYYYSKKKNNLYESKLTPSLAYLIKENVVLADYDNTFINSNKIYKSFGNQDNIFKIIDDYKYYNLKLNDNSFQIIDNECEAYFTKTIKITQKSILYFEAINSYDNYPKQELYYSFDVYINDELVAEKYPNKKAVNTIDLGMYEKETINIKVVVRKNIEFKYIVFGLLDTEKLENFYRESNGINAQYVGNKIKVKYQGNQGGIIFIPTNYLDGMKVTLNNKKTDIIKVYNNFIGIKVDGDSDILISYVPKWFNLGIIVSCIGIVLAILYNKYQNKVDFFKNFAYIVYLSLIVVLFIVIYLIPLIMFCISYIS